MVWFVVGFYALGCVVFWRAFVWAFIESSPEPGEEPGGPDVFFGVLFGTAFDVVFWPLVAVVLVVRHLYRGRHASVLSALMPRAIRRERELADQAERIEALEREVGPVIHNSRDVPEAQALIRRLCALQERVASEVLGHSDAADCFCGEGGYWPYDDAIYYRNEGTAVDFIVEATLAAIAERRARP